MDEEAKKEWIEEEERAGKAEVLVKRTCMTAAHSILKFIRENSIMEEEKLLEQIAGRIEGACMMSTMVIALG